jgi:hypothetical protein
MLRIASLWATTLLLAILVPFVHAANQSVSSCDPRIQYNGQWIMQSNCDRYYTTQDSATASFTFQGVHVVLAAPRGLLTLERD